MLKFWFLHGDFFLGGHFMFGCHLDVFGGDDSLGALFHLEALQQHKIPWNWEKRLWNDGGLIRTQGGCQIFVIPNDRMILILTFLKNSHIGIFPSCFTC